MRGDVLQRELVAPDGGRIGLARLATDNHLAVGEKRRELAALAHVSSVIGRRGGVGPALIERVGDSAPRRLELGLNGVGIVTEDRNEIRLQAGNGRRRP